MKKVYIIIGLCLLVLLSSCSLNDDQLNNHYEENEIEIRGTGNKGNITGGPG